MKSLCVLFILIFGLQAGAQKLGDDPNDKIGNSDQADAFEVSAPTDVMTLLEGVANFDNAGETRLLFRHSNQGESLTPFTGRQGEGSGESRSSERSTSEK